MLIGAPPDMLTICRWPASPSLSCDFILIKFLVTPCCHWDSSLSTGVHLQTHQPILSNSHPFKHPLTNWLIGTQLKHLSLTLRRTLLLTLILPSRPPHLIVNIRFLSLCDIIGSICGFIAWQSPPRSTSIVRLQSFDFNRSDHEL